MSGLGYEIRRRRTFAWLTELASCLACSSVRSWPFCWQWQPSRYGCCDRSKQMGYNKHKNHSYQHGDASTRVGSARRGLERNSGRTTGPWHDEA
jgi:hypothetical protein